VTGMSSLSMQAEGDVSAEGWGSVVLLSEGIGVSVWPERKLA
jgi:hypothetical protein